MSIASSIRSIGFGATWPFMAIFFNVDLGIPIYEVGIIFTLLSVVSIVVSLIGGGLADRIGRKNTLLIGSLLGFTLYLSLSLMLILKVPIIFVIVVFIVSATSGALIFPAASALVADYTDVNQRMKGYVIYRILSNLGWAIGPLIGSFLFNSGLDIIFLYVSLSSLVQFIVVILTVKDQKNKNITKKSGERFSLLVLDKYLIVFGLATFLVTMVASQFSVTFPIYANIKAGIPTADLGYIYAVNGTVVVVGQYPMIMVLKRFPDIFIMILGAIFYSVGYFIVSFSHNLVGLMFDMLIITMGENLTSPMINTVVSKIAAEGKMARYMGFIGMINSTGRALGPSIGSTFLYIFAYNGLKVWSAVDLFGLGSIVIFMVFSGMIFRNSNLKERGIINKKI
ncbi:MFS transporter [Oxyplasma meridianum]|uniref:MFS transporter n=1 Tax=Oxyplasma meridianum TaxID=3073602 RepID=A0AAX4NGZ4_9ARCH